MNRVIELISKLNLQKHPEGGYFAETYRSNQIIDGKTGAFPSGRSFGTSIYFLLNGNDCSKFHRIKSDETWHFYEGSPIEISMIFNDGRYESVVIGPPNPTPVFQFTVPANTWFGAKVTDKNGYALVGCTVAPGFDFRDFEMADGDELLRKFPAHQKIIQELT